MTEQEAFARITFDPEVMGGQACIRGLRVPVSLVLNLVANGRAPAEIVDDYPYLEPADIEAALRYAAWVTREELHPLEVPPR